MNQPLLAVDELRHLYKTDEGEQLVLDGISFVVEQGEFVSIVGPSGCGKTTLLRSLSGLLQPTSGTVALNGTPINGVPKGLAMVFQDYRGSLFPWRKVGANVEFPLLGVVSKEERAKRVRESLAAVGLEKSANRYPWQLSGGMQQRVAIARALAMQPQLLLMDEPFASVDAQTRSELEDLLLRVRDQFDMTILFVTHDVDESVYLSSRVLSLSKAPTVVTSSVPIPLPTPRDQIGSREDPRFVQLRGEVARLIRSAAPGGLVETKTGTVATAL
ncbi:ABC transporter ATP-binding protein [Salinibacterium sp. GXW1014]|uniref:ABC transporter ATP-binding protein n=1 Tax=Salinibacterium sp. GXW1014 TaxID=3377838 RepID=UPI00383BD6A1